MGTFTQIPINTFNALQLDAGVLLTNFDPTNPSLVNADIITATTGGITVSCKPTFSDLAEDVDNAPNDVLEFKHLDSWECLVSTTSLGTSAELIQLALGCADISNNTKITPRSKVELSDFKDIWWVGDRADGGLVACKIINALSTGGLELKTEKNAKGQITLELKGHVSIQDQTKMPMEFYSSPANFTVTFNSQGGSAVPSQVVADGGKATSPTDPTKDGYTFGGWYKEAAGTNAWTFATDTVTENTTLYAKWTASA